MSDELSIDQARTLFETRRAAWLAEDVDAYLALFADDMTIALPGRDEAVRGKSAYREIVEQGFTHIAPVSWAYHHLAVTGDHVLSEWTIGGRLRRRAYDVTWRGMATCRLRGGLIEAWREYWDPAVLRAQLGRGDRGR